MSASPGVTITGTITDLAGNGAQGTVVFTLCNQGAVIPAISGVGEIGNLVYTVNAASNGTWSVTLWGNYQFSNAPNSFYEVSVFGTDTNGMTGIVPSSTAAYQFNAGGSFDISTVTPYASKQSFPTGFTPVLLNPITTQTITGQALGLPALILNGTLTDSTSSVGTNGQVLSSTGSGTQWIAPTVPGLSIASGKTLAASNTLTFTGTDGTSFAFPSSSDTVVTLAATQTLTNKTLTAPVLGAATATSINGLTVTTSTGTLMIANGKTLTASNSLTLTGTDSTSFAFPSSSDTVAGIAATQTLTNKTISGASNTLSAIANSSLSHSTIGLTDSTGLFTVTGSPAALGGAITLSAFAAQTANTVLRSGSGTPSFSALVVADLPTTGYALGASAATTPAAFNNSTSLATTAYVDNTFISGATALFDDDFLYCSNAVTVTTGSVYPGDTDWSAIQVTGGSQVLTSQSGTFQNPGQLLITTPATGNDGCALYKGGGGNTTGPLGVLGNSAGWRYDAWFQTAATITNYCVRVGLAKGGQQAADAPTSGMWIEYDTANANSNSLWTIRTVSASASNYSTTNMAAPVASTFYHVRIRSTAAGTILFSIGSANGALNTETSITTDVDTTSNMMPWLQVIPRTTAAVTLVVDRISFFAATGRV